MIAWGWLILAFAIGVWFGLGIMKVRYGQQLETLAGVVDDLKSKIKVIEEDVDERNSRSR